MKTKIATALSMVGVLGAGSAAALVNTQILDSGPSSGASAAVLPPATAVDVSIPATLPIETSTTAPTSVAPTSTTAPTTAGTTATTAPSTAPAPTGYLTAFNVGDAGVVTVDVIDGQIVLVSAEPKAGWKRTKAEAHDDENQVEVVFVSATVRVEFEATFVDGQIVPKVESKAIAATASTNPPTTAAPAPAPAPAPATTVHHDEHDDEHEDEDEREDDHRDDEHDDDGGEHDDD